MSLCEPQLVSRSREVMDLRFVKSLGVTVAMAKTAVKYLHHVAMQYDLAIYFEEGAQL